MNGEPEGDQNPVEPPPERPPDSLGNISLADRWAPLVENPDKPAIAPVKPAQRLLAAATCLILLALFLWMIS